MIPVSAAFLWIFAGFLMGMIFGGIVMGLYISGGFADPDTIARMEELREARIAASRSRTAAAFLKAYKKHKELFMQLLRDDK